MRINGAKLRAEWQESHKAEVEWLRSTAVRQKAKALKGEKAWDFPISLSQSLDKWGCLTVGQLAAVRKCMQKDSAPQVEAPEVDWTKLADAFTTARENAAAEGEGVKWLKLRLGSFIFSDAPATDKWPAAIFIKDADKKLKLGRISQGRLFRSDDCTDEQVEEILGVLADPAEAATAYGLRTGRCACCGAELTNAESRERGIGPICAERYGF